MATLEARGYVNKLEIKTSSGGKTYCKFTLAVAQKRKDREGKEVKEKVYINCVDFSEGPFPTDGEYTGVTGYLTVTGWCKDGKGGANLDVTVKSYEKIAQLAPRDGGSAPKADAPPADPFALGT